MTVHVEFPSIVAFLRDYLRESLARNGYPSVEVTDKYRGDKVEVWLQRDGGSARDVRDFPRIRVNCFHDGKDGDPVDELTQRVSTILRASAGQGPIRKATVLSGPIPVDGHKPRRYLLVEFVVVGEPITLV